VLWKVEEAKRNLQCKGKRMGAKMEFWIDCLGRLCSERDIGFFIGKKWGVWVNYMTTTENPLGGTENSQHKDFKSSECGAEIRKESW
jgi:hypothetical protein